MPNFLIHNSYGNVRFWHEADKLTGLKVSFEREAEIDNFFKQSSLVFMIKI